MSDYSIQNDSNLKYYVHFPQGTNGNIHRSHEANFYYTTQDLGVTETFLLMPASQDNGIWYYVFTTDPQSNACWTLNSSDESEKLEDAAFAGTDYQKFSFENADSSHVYILCKGSGKYLYRSDQLMDAHHPIRQSKNKDSSKYFFTVTPRTDMMPVYMPTSAGPQITDSTLLYTTRLLGTPPFPKSYGDQPAFPAKVFIGETLIPCFQVSEDPSVIGPNLINWQVNYRPYYRYRRDQQFQYAAGSDINIAQGGIQTKTYTYSYGLEKTDSTSLETKTSFLIGYTSNKSATVGTKGVSATASHGFNTQWSRDLTTTISESLTTSENTTVTDSLVVDATNNNVTYIDWQACDIWTIYYDNFTSRQNDDSQNYSWVVPSDMHQATSYPQSVPVTVSETSRVSN